jgi:hypothetical protein
MRQVKKNKTNHIGATSSGAGLNKNKFVVTIGVLGVLVLLSFIWIIMENFGGGNLNFNNSTDYKVEYMKATFMNDEWQISDTMAVENVEAGSKSSVNFGTEDLNNMEASLQIELKFEGYDRFVLDAGYFNDLFTGNINVTLKQNNSDEVEIYIKAKNGILSSATTDCNENYTIYVKEGYIE